MLPTDRLNSPTYVVLVLPLPAVAGRVEDLPAPVHSATGLPARYGSRWLLRSERWTVTQGTLRKKAHALARLYSWGEHQAFLGGIDGRISRNEPFTTVELDGLVAFLRDRSNSRARVAQDPRVVGTDPNGSPVFEEVPAQVATYSAGTLSNTLAVCGDFLTWALQPELRGSTGTIDGRSSSQAIVAMQAAFTAHRHGAGKGERLRPLTVEGRMAFDAIFSFTGETVGTVWHDDNPFVPALRLRNYYMLGLMRHCGLRAGEVLALREGDILAMQVEMLDYQTGELTCVRKPVVRIVRRHNVPGDTRKRHAFVKTQGRHIPLPVPLHAALARYIKAQPPVGRRGVETPMLFVSSQGEGPLTKVALDVVVSRIMYALKKHGYSGVSPHGLRHTFFEEQAEYLLALPRSTVESVSNILRSLGGWENNSVQPFHYAQAAYRRRSNSLLVDFNEQRFETIASCSKPKGVPRTPRPNVPTASTPSPLLAQEIGDHAE